MPAPPKGSFCLFFFLFLLLINCSKPSNTIQMWNCSRVYLHSHLKCPSDHPAPDPTIRPSPRTASNCRVPGWTGPRDDRSCDGRGRWPPTAQGPRRKQKRPRRNDGERCNGKVLFLMCFVFVFFGTKNDTNNLDLKTNTK